MGICSTSPLSVQGFCHAPIACTSQATIMTSLAPLEVELVSTESSNSFTGIGRYTRNLSEHLRSRLIVRMARHLYLPLSNCIDPLHYFPIGIRPHHRGSVVHFTEDLGCSQMLWRPMRPAVATSHDLGFLAWPPEAKMHRPLDRILLYISYMGLKQMDAVITVSEYARQVIIRRLKISPERIFVVHSGNDQERFQKVPDARRKLAQKHRIPSDPGCSYLLYVGAEYPRKNLLTILKALKRLPSNVKLLKVGPHGGSRFRQITEQAIADLDLRNRVYFLDQVPDEDLPMLYSAADVYVCASFLEGFGHPVLEAMACRTPVVASDAGSLPEITAGASLLVTPADVDGFTEVIYRVLQDEPLRLGLAEAGFRRAACFSWEQAAEQTAAVYRWATENRRSQA